MNSKCIVFTRPDGGVSVIHPVISEDDPATLDENGALERAKKDVPPGAINVHIVDRATLPGRTFRDAWVSDGATVSVDMAAAKDLQRTRMRVARTAKLAVLDIAYSRADAKDDTATKADIEANRQRLRDVTSDPAIEAALTPEALASVWPEILT